MSNETTTDPNIEVTHTKSTLKCKLTEAELLKCARDMADAQQEAAVLEKELKDLNTQRKSAIEMKKGIAASNGDMIRCGYEFRQVECDVVKDYKSGMVTIMRNDTFETIDSREMTEAEAQARLAI